MFLFSQILAIGSLCALLVLIPFVALVGGLLERSSGYPALRLRANYAIAGGLSMLWVEAMVFLVLLPRLLH